MMRRLAGAAVLCAFATLLPLAPGCGGAEAPAPSAESEERAATRLFWKTLNEATQRRMDGDLDGAVAAYREALAHDPAHEDALYYLGQCLDALGRHDEAREALERLVAVNPNSSRGHIALGALHANPDQPDQFDARVAASHFRRAHEINAEETGPMLRLGEVLLVMRDIDEAGAWFEATLRSNPNSVEAACLAGYLDWRRGDAESAGAMLHRALEAGRVRAPVAGVLGEGDRRAASDRHAPPPPLERPMGRTLFGDLCDALGENPEDLDAAYAPIDAHLDILATRGAADPESP